MKKILLSSTVLTAALVGTVLLVPSRVQAATAKEKFASMRVALAKAFRDGELTVTGTLVDADTASFSVLLDGSPLPPDIPVKVIGEKHQGYSDFSVKIDFSDGNFSSIRFGKDKNTLELVPKAAPNVTDTVRLDPKTGKPLSWTQYKSGTSKANASVTTINYKNEIVHVSPTLPAAGKTSVNTSDNPTPLDDTITAHIRFVTK